MDADDAGGLPDGDEDDDIPHPDKMKDEDRLYSRGLGRKLMKYLKDGDEKGTDDFLKGLDKDDKKKLTSYMKYSCDDSESKEKYAAKCGCGMDSGEMKAGEPDRYGKSGEKKGNTLSTENDASIKYAKLREEKEQLAKKYQKLQVITEELKATNQEQQKQLDKLRTSERCAIRYAKFKDLESQGIVLDPDEEMSRTADYSDDQFRRHTEEIIPQHYSKTSSTFPQFGQNRETSAVRLGMDAAAQKYCNQAKELVLKYKKDRKNVDYQSVLRNLIDNEGKVDESKLFAINGNGKAH